MFGQRVGCKEHIQLRAHLFDESGVVRTAEQVLGLARVCLQIIELARETDASKWIAKDELVTRTSDHSRIAIFAEDSVVAVLRCFSAQLAEI